MVSTPSNAIMEGQSRACHVTQSRTDGDSAGTGPVATKVARVALGCCLFRGNPIRHLYSSRFFCAISGCRVRGVTFISFQRFPTPYRGIEFFFGNTASLHVHVHVHVPSHESVDGIKERHGPIPKYSKDVLL